MATNHRKHQHPIVAGIDPSFVQFFERSLRFRFRRARALARLRSLWMSQGTIGGIIAACVCLGGPSVAHMMEQMTNAFAH
ncbi:MAG TPA: hypothetical protein VGM78_01675 [Ilumatobacteraceae bacterium]